MLVLFEDEAFCSLLDSVEGTVGGLYQKVSSAPMSIGILPFVKYVTGILLKYVAERMILLAEVS